ncbi:MAG: hypothetical protein E4G71_03375 [Candidatus Atribacteria bacterium]|nr:MAG: hypothetical protein E4G71_03375 [Candidatus Atribacteria bacterium]
MPYSAVIKRFTAMLRFDIVEYYRYGDNASEGLIMGLNGIMVHCMLLIYNLLMNMGIWEVIFQKV